MFGRSSTTTTLPTYVEPLEGGRARTVTVLPGIPLPDGLVEAYFAETAAATAAANAVAAPVEAPAQARVAEMAGVGAGVVVGAPVAPGSAFAPPVGPPPVGAPLTDFAAPDDASSLVAPSPVQSTPASAADAEVHDGPVDVLPVVGAEDPASPAPAPRTFFGLRLGRRESGLKDSLRPDVEHEDPLADAAFGAPVVADAPAVPVDAPVEAAVAAGSFAGLRAMLGGLKRRGADSSETGTGPELGTDDWPRSLVTPPVGLPASADQAPAAPDETPLTSASPAPLAAPVGAAVAELPPPVVAQRVDLPAPASAPVDLPSPLSSALPIATASPVAAGPAETDTAYDVVPGAPVPVSAFARPTAPADVPVEDAPEPVADTAIADSAIADSTVADSAVTAPPSGPPAEVAPPVAVPAFGNLVPTQQLAFPASLDAAATQVAAQVAAEHAGQAADAAGSTADAGADVVGASVDGDDVVEGVLEPETATEPAGPSVGLVFADGSHASLDGGVEGAALTQVANALTGEPAPAATELRADPNE